MRAFALILAASYAAFASAASLADIKAKVGSDGIYALSDSSFGDVALAPNRDYHVFVVFNALSPGVNCPVCHRFDKEVGLAARTLRSDTPDAPVVFARADYVDCRSAFTKLGLKGVPHLVHYGPTGSDDSHSETEFPAGGVFQLSENVDAEGVASFVERRAGVSLKIVRPQWPRVVMALAVLGGLTFAGFTMGPTLWGIYEVLRDQYLVWLLGCGVVYFVAVSGIIYDIIRKVPMIGVNGGRPEVISRQNGVQYVAEGFVIGGLNVLAGGGVIALAMLGQTWGKNRKAIITDSTKVCALIAIAAFVLGFGWIVGIYKYKSQWYRPIGMFGL